MRHFSAAIVFALALAGCTDQVVEVGPQARADLPVSPFEMVSVDLAEASTSSATSAAKSSALVTDCSFTVSGSTMSLDADCTTDGTIFIPDGMTLAGNGHTITAVDPPAGGFLGAVVQNAGTVAHVHDLTVTASGLANGCKGGVDRLRGIMLKQASGSITHSTVTGINKGASGCQEGNAIEVRNAPFDGTHPNTQTVEIAHNNVYDYQKTGILTNGDVQVSVHHNKVGASATQHNLAANSLQMGFGAGGSAVQNALDGNQWFGPSDFAATAILLYQTDAVDVSKNNIRGNAGLGIYAFTDNSTLNNNKIFDEGADGGHYDIGLGNYGVNNSVTNNKVKKYDVPYEGVSGGGNKVVGPEA